MYVAPNTTIRLIKDCPLDNGYEHTIFFMTEAAQNTYFMSTLSGFTFSAQSYQRVNKGTLRVAQNAESLYAVNYLAFQNTAFGSKWFYAFVTRIDYINNGVSEITYEIDILQTWHFDYKMMPTFVEREHIENDAVGNNLVPETLETGEYVTQTSTVDSTLEPLSIVLAAPFDRTYQPVSGGIYSQLFSGLCLIDFPMGYYPIDDPDHPGEYGPNVARAFISGAGAQAANIVAAFLMPTCFVTAEGAAVFPAYHTKSMTKLTSGAIDTYTGVKNNKLYTYPYNFLYVTNQQGSGVEFPYEYFSTTTCDFYVSGDMSPNPSVVLRPKNYKGVALNTDEKMVLTGYPQIPFNIDAFKAWLAMNASNLAVDALSNAGTLAAGIMTANPGVIAGGVMNVLRNVSSVYQHSIQPRQAKGGGGSITACALRYQNFLFMQKTVRGEFARIIDDFFSLYGYATHRVKIPNRTGRPEWNYVKTANCKIDPGYPQDATPYTGTYPEVGVPADDARRIEAIYNNGITFWHNPAHVGNYALANWAPINPPAHS